MPTFDNGYYIGGTPSWMPLFRHERSCTFTTNLTKILPKHELRVGLDFVRHELNHYQAEFGDYGLKGGFSFGGHVTGAPGYTALGLEPVRRLPARPSQLLLEGRAGDRDDRPREPVGGSSSATAGASPRS